MGGSAGAPAGWPGGAAPIVVAVSARVGLVTDAVYGRHRPAGLGRAGGAGQSTSWPGRGSCGIGRGWAGMLPSLPAW